MWRPCILQHTTSTSKLQLSNFPSSSLASVVATGNKRNVMTHYATRHFGRSHAPCGPADWQPSACMALAAPQPSALADPMARVRGPALLVSLWLIRPQLFVSLRLRSNLWPLWTPRTLYHPLCLSRLLISAQGYHKHDQDRHIHVDDNYIYDPDPHIRVAGSLRSTEP